MNSDRSDEEPLPSYEFQPVGWPTVLRVVGGLLFFATVVLLAAAAKPGGSFAWPIFAAANGLTALLLAHLVETELHAAPALPACIPRAALDDLRESMVQNVDCFGTHLDMPAAELPLELLEHLTATMVHVGQLWDWCEQLGRELNAVSAGMPRPTFEAELANARRVHPWLTLRLAELAIGAATEPEDW